MMMIMYMLPATLSISVVVSEIQILLLYVLNLPAVQQLMMFCGLAWVAYDIYYSLVKKNNKLEKGSAKK